MRLLTFLVLTSWYLAAAAFATDTVGTASSSASFEVNGVAMRSRGVTSWPVVAGDEVHAVGSPVILRFQDGSRMTIGEESRVKLVRNGDRVSVNLLGGQAQFTLTEQSALQVMNLGREVGYRSGAISTRASPVTRPAGTPQPAIARVPPPPLSTQ